MMIRTVRTAAIAIGILYATASICTRGEAPAPQPLSGPYASGNLTIFLIRGPDRVSGKTFLTLDDALQQKKAIVHETNNVNQLSIDNVSSDEALFIQAGDIVKGGQQDRVLAFDLVVPPQTKNAPLSCFCVEAGRWNRREGEAADSFARAQLALPTNDLKVAVRAQASQQEVWSKVTKAQGEISKKVMADVKDTRSATSLQLTLENKKLNEAIDKTVKELSAAPDKKTDVIGVATAINGKVIGADIYASADLFRKLWPKLIRAAAVEAIAERKEGSTFSQPDEKAVRAFLADADAGKVKETTVSRRINQLTKTGNAALLFESRDNENGAALRRSYLKK